MSLTKTAARNSLLLFQNKIKGFESEALQRIKNQLDLVIVRIPLVQVMNL